MDSILGKGQKSTLILVWIFLTSTAPFIFFRWPGHPYKILTFLCLTIMIFQISMVYKKKIFDYKILFVISLQSAYYFLLVACYNDFSSLNLVIQLISLFILISYIKCFIGFKRFVKSFIIVMIAMGIGGTIIFFLHILKGVNPVFKVEYGFDTSFFLWLTTTNIFVDTGSLRILRYSGFFDEPGTFALFTTFALVLNKIYFNSKKYELLLILTTIFTFSMAFYFTLLFYLLFFYVNKSTFSYFLVFLLFIPLTFMLIKKIDVDIYNTVYAMTIERFQDTKSDISGTNRGDLMEHDYKAFIENPIFGKGPRPGDVLGSNVYGVIAKYGIIGTLFFYSFLLFIVLLWLKMNFKNQIFYGKLLFIILLSLFHRPELSSVLTLIIFYSIIHFMRYGEKLIDRNEMKSQLIVSA